MFIVAAKRTPFGAYGGLLKDFTATDLTEFAARAALSAGRVSPETIDSVIVGNVIQVSRAEGRYSFLVLYVIKKVISLICLNVNSLIMVKGIYDFSNPVTLEAMVYIIQSHI